MSAMLADLLGSIAPGMVYGSWGGGWGSRCVV